MTQLLNEKEYKEVISLAQMLSAITIVNNVDYVLHNTFLQLKLAKLSNNAKEFFFALTNMI